MRGTRGHRRRGLVSVLRLLDLLHQLELSGGNFLSLRWLLLQFRLLKQVAHTLKLILIQLVDNIQNLAAVFINLLVSLTRRNDDSGRQDFPGVSALNRDA